MSKFKVSEVKSNGVGGKGYQGVLIHKDAIMHIDLLVVLQDIVLLTLTAMS